MIIVYLHFQSQHKKLEKVGTDSNVRALDSGIPGENKMGAIEVLLGG